MSARVAVLMGGWSAEREVSLVSGTAIQSALRELNYEAETIDVDHDIANVLSAARPDIAFNALHGRFGEDGCMQGILETLEIPYTHSGVLASALAMNKPAALSLFQGVGLACAEGKVVAREALLNGDVMAPPYVIKPVNEGSSVGVTLVFEGDNFKPSDMGEWPYGDSVLLESYIPGHEIHVAVMGDRPLGVIEIQPKGRFYDYQAKYTDGKATHIMPAPLPRPAYDEALDIALTAHRALGCRGVTRADLRYDDTEGTPGKFYILELNTQPGMTPLSLVPEIAAYHDIGFSDLVKWIVEDAGCNR